MAGPPPPLPSRFRHAVARGVGAAFGIAWLGFFGWLLMERAEPIDVWVKKQGGGLQLPLDEILGACWCVAFLFVIASTGFVAGFVCRLIDAEQMVASGDENERAGP